ncbi:MAG: hypothetical protein NTX56_07750 [Proteobacteria bacterium]|nr:hypothetical protein [Pseudomonadota bacterium]
MPIKRLEDQWTLVIAGAWNPAILSPNWVAKEVLKLAVDSNFQVGMQVAINDPSQPIGFEFEGIAYAPALNVLMFHLKPELDREKMVGAAAKILELLPHTPITGIGFNSGFEIECGIDDLLKSFSAGTSIPDFLTDADAQLVKQGWGATVATKDRLINMTCKLEAGKVSIGFNVHMEVTSALSAAEKLRVPGLLTDILNDVESILVNVAKEQLQ